MTKVFIDGSEGTTGLRLASRLEKRQDIRLLEIDPALRKDEVERAKISNSADVVFLCLPDQAARNALAGITNPEVKVIDTSTAHRVRDEWAYGLPELSPPHREKVSASKRICVPGCHATGFSLLVYPLMAKGVAGVDYPLTAHSVTGYSGGGKQVIAAYSAPDRPSGYATPRQYALDQTHKHLPEMQKVSGLSHPPAFNPIIADFYSGMVVSVPLHLRLLKGKPTAQDLHSLLSEFYAGQELIRVAEWGEALPGGMLEPETLSGRDDLEIHVFGGGEHALLAARFDNLGKGASCGAIQCMNLSMGLPESSGLLKG